ncbi:MAG: GlsB/YeaQ/YmgE family stress response membrane protein [Candidatus Dojkabacteria bacterium]
MILVLFIIIGFPIGYLVGRLQPNKGFGEGGNTLIGLAGAIMIGILFDRLQVGFLLTLGMSAAGAISFLFIANAFLRRS